MTTRTITIQYRTSTGRVILSEGWTSFRNAARREAEIVAAGGTVLNTFSA